MLDHQFGINIQTSTIYNQEEENDFQTPAQMLNHSLYMTGSPIQIF